MVITFEQFASGQTLIEPAEVDGKETVLGWSVS